MGDEFGLRSSTGDLMAQRDRFQQQRSEGSRFAASGASENDALVAVPIACRLPPTHHNHQQIRADQVMRNHRRLHSPVASSWILLV